MSRTYGDRGDKDNKIRLLKRQIESQKREIARLKKELSKAQSAITDFLNGSDDDDGLDDKARKRGDELLCENCYKGTYRVFAVPLRGGETRTYLTCNVCNYRKSHK